MSKQKKIESKKAHTAQAEIIEALEPGVSPVAGITLNNVIRTHKETVWFANWSPDGNLLATSSEESLFIHNIKTGESKRLLYNSRKEVSLDVSWSPNCKHIAVALGSKIKIMNVKGEETLKTLRTHNNTKISLLEFSPDGSMLACSTSPLDNIIIWDVALGKEKITLGPFSGPVFFIWSNDGTKLYVLIYNTQKILLYDTLNWKSNTIINNSNLTKKGIDNVALNSKYLGYCSDNSIYIWNIETKKLDIVLEGHTSSMTSLSFSNDGNLLVSKSHDQTIKFWRCDSWQEVATIGESTLEDHIGIEMSFNPKFPYFVTRAENETVIRIWKIDLPALLNQSPKENSIRYTTARLILVGDSGVGKTGLGWRLAHNAYKEHESTHGQQFWVVNELGITRKDGTVCEAVLWDLAGQPDYRLVHSLFLDNVDLGLLLFDPTARQEPLNGPLFWLKQLQKNHKSKCAIVLIGSRVDRGMPTLTTEELDGFCKMQEINGGFIATSAKTGEGLQELLDRIKGLIPWDSLRATITTATFKKIKEYILSLKESTERKNVLITPSILKSSLKKSDKKWQFTDDEMMTAVQNLANHGYVSILQSSNGDTYILLVPELLSNLASSFVLEARRNPRGLGVLEEDRLLKGSYKFPELTNLIKKEKETLLDAATVLFLQRTICFRETFNEQGFLVFPSLINEKRPITDDTPVIEDVYYRVHGPVENVFASLVVLLGYTNTFIRNNQWQNQAQYQLGKGEICGFKQIANGEGEIELILYYVPNIPEHVKSLFQGLFERFLSRKDLKVFRYQPVNCPTCKERLARTVVMQQLEKGKSFSFCNECGSKIILPTIEDLYSGFQRAEEKLDEQEAIALRRTAFEAALVRIKGILRDKSSTSSGPKCFISYAWGEAKHEEWTNRLAIDLRKAGIDVLFDKWHNIPGSSISQFVDRILDSEFAIVVGTSLLKKKYESKTTDPVVTAEQKLINTRLRQPVKYGADSVIPILLEDEPHASFTPLLQDVVYVDFRNEEYYFYNLFSLLWRLYKLDYDHPLFDELHNSLKPATWGRTFTV